MTVGTYVYAVSSVTGRTGKSQFVVYVKSTLAVRTLPATLARIDVTEGASAISFGELDGDADLVGDDVS